MSHKKSNSTIHVPFSWEKTPGVPKFMGSPRHALASGLTSDHDDQVMRKTDLPLPPGSFKQPLGSASKRSFSWEEDPFLAAIIECTKDTDKFKDKGEIRKISFGTRVRKSKSFLLSCKYSFDVEPGHLLTRPSSLGSIVWD